MADVKLSKLRKGDLQELASHLNVATDGLRSEIEERILAYAKKQGGFEALAANGILKEGKYLSALGLEKPAEGGRSPSKAVPSGDAAKKTDQSIADLFAHTPSWEFVAYHSPFKFLSFLEHHLTPSGIRTVLSDTRSFLTRSDTLVLLLIYVECFTIVWHHLGWSANPIFTIPTPGGLCSNSGSLCSSNGIAVHWPVFAPLLERKAFLYPLFYWKIYFVVIPTLLGWIVNFQARRTAPNAKVCPVNMLTFSYARLVVFFFLLKSTVGGLLGGDAPEFSHRSVTMLFGGLLSLKLFFTTTVTGILYAFYEKE